MTEPSPQPNLAALFSPRSIAVIGASADPQRIGGAPIKLLLEAGFSAIYPVNPKYPTIQSLECFASIEDVPHAVDLVIIATSAPDVLAQLERSHRRGVRAAVIFAAGFAEVGADGLRMQSDITAFARRTGMAILGPNAIGIVNWRDQVFATFARSFEPTQPVGGTALIGQSGNISSAVYRRARKMGVTFCCAVSTGNEAGLTVADYLGYLADDASTDAALCYVESVRDGPKFMQAARRFRAQGKLLAVLKAGSSAKGAEAAHSHTAALAGDRVAYATAFAEAGVAVAEDVAHLGELAYMHRFRDRTIGGNAAVVTVSGAAGTLLADALSERGIRLPTLSPALQEKLKGLIPEYGNSANPVDLTGNVSNGSETVEAALRLLLESAEVDILVLYIGGRILQQIWPALERFSKQHKKLMVIIDATESGVRDHIEAMGLPYFDELGAAVRAVTTYVKWVQGARGKGGDAAFVGRAGDPAGLPHVNEPHIVDAGATAKGDCAPPRSMGEIEAKAALRAAGMKVVADRLAATADEAVTAAEATGYPVVLKLVSPDILHKTDVGGVKLGLSSPRAVAEAFAEIIASAQSVRPDARVNGVTVEPHIRDAHELLVGAQRDPVFGWMMTIGCGGIWTEVFNDAVHAFLPVDEQRARELFARLRSFRLLEGYRGAPAADISAACKAVASLSAFLLRQDEDVVALEINPLMVGPAGQGAIIVDALITRSSGAAAKHPILGQPNVVAELTDPGLRLQRGGVA